MTDETLAPLKVQWRCEHRIVSGEIQRLQRRKEELEEMLATFFPEAKHG
jgi:hypothetical protein